MGIFDWFLKKKISSEEEATTPLDLVEEFNYKNSIFKKTTSYYNTGNIKKELYEGDNLHGGLLCFLNLYYESGKIFKKIDYYYKDAIWEKEIYFKSGKLMIRESRKFGDYTFIEYLYDNEKNTREGIAVSHKGVQLNLFFSKAGVTEGYSISDTVKKITELLLGEDDPTVLEGYSSGISSGLSSYHWLLVEEQFNDKKTAQTMQSQLEGFFNIGMMGGKSTLGIPIDYNIPKVYPYKQKVEEIISEINELIKTKKSLKKNKEILKEYYENGKLKYEAEVIDGVKNGYYKDYYESGALKVETTFKDDEMDGECKFYFESGNLSELSHYTAGEPTVGSIVKRYFENGDLQEEVSVSKEGDEFKETVIKNNLDFLKIDVTAFPESTIKDINELDEEKRKQLMDITIFFDKYGYADKTKGRASTIIEGLEFISKLKGIKEDEFVFDIATFLRMGDDYPPTTDKDGKWYVKFGNTLVKYFSEKKFKPALKELLKANNIEEKIVTCECSEDCYCSRKVRIDMRLGAVTQIFAGDGFEICYVIGSYNGKDVSEFIVKNPDVPIFIPKNKDGLRDYKVINFPGEFESYAKKLYDVYNEEDSKIINIRNTAEQDKQSLSYIHIEGKGLFNL